MKNLTQQYFRSFTRNFGANAFSFASRILLAGFFSLSIHTSLSAGNPGLGQAAEPGNGNNHTQHINPPEHPWWDPQYKFKVEEDPASVNEEYPANNATTELVTSRISANHPPVGPLPPLPPVTRVRLKVSVSQSSAIVDFFDIVDQDGDALNFTFNTHGNIYIQTWDPFHKKLTIGLDLLEGQTAEIVVTVHDTRMNGSDKGTPFTRIVEVVGVP